MALLCCCSVQILIKSQSDSFVLEAIIAIQTLPLFMNFHSGQEEEGEKKFTQQYHETGGRAGGHTSNRTWVGQDNPQVPTSSRAGKEALRRAITFQLPSLTLLITWPAPVPQEGSLR